MGTADTSVFDIGDMERMRLDRMPLSDVLSEAPEPYRSKLDDLLNQIAMSFARAQFEAAKQMEICCV